MSTFVSTLQPELSTFPSNVDNYQTEINKVGLTSLASTLAMAAYQPEHEALKTIDELYRVWANDDLAKAHEILRDGNSVASHQLDKLLRQYRQRQC
jgi:hypothetical protein